MCSAKIYFMVLAFSAVYVFDAKTQPTVPETSESFMTKIEGSWQLVDLNVGGRSTPISSYGPSVFTKDVWIMQTKRGDRRFEIKNTGDNDGATEITCVKRDKILGGGSFVALARIRDDKLTIARGTGNRFDPDGTILPVLPRPKSIEPGARTMVYSFVRSNPVVTPKPRIMVRIINKSKTPPEILVDQTIPSHFGGGFNYASNAIGTMQRNEVSRPGTVIDGTVDTGEDGETKIKIDIRITNSLATKLPKTDISRSQSFFVQTVLPTDGLTQIDCGENIWCELSVEPQPDRPSDKPDRRH